jgi:anthranilate synthase component 2
VEVDVVYNDQLAIPSINHYDKILLSPGPGIPSEAGQLMDVIERFADQKPILGICLGHQAIAEHFGSSLHNLSTPLHGVQSTLDITESDYLFEGVPEQFQIGHYHSWVVNPDGPNTLEVIATDEQTNIMAIRHPHYDIRGFQFHPESILTEHGEQLLKNWIKH